MDLAQKPSVTSLASPAADAAPLPPETGAAPAWPLRRQLSMVTVGWIFGAVWMTATSGAPITLFAQGLGATPFQFGLLAALPFLASLVSMPGSLLSERTGERRSVFLFSHYTQRLVWFVVALAPVYIVSRWGMGQAPAAMGLFLTLMFFMHAAGAVGGPAWVSWMADVVPTRVRGTYFSRRRQWGILSAIPAALLVGWVLDRYVHPDAGDGIATPGQTLAMLRWCAIIFMGAALFGLVDIDAFRNLPHAPKPPQRGAGLLKAFADPLRNGRFLTFAGFVATLTFAVSFMNQFVTLYLIEKVKVDNTGTQLMLLVAPMLAQLLILPVWGKMADRVGRKPMLVIAALGMVPIGLGWCFVTQDNPWLGYLLSAGGAALWTGVEIANFNVVLEMSGADPKKGGSSYVAVNSVIINIAGCLGGLAAGLIAQHLKDWSWQPLEGFKAFTYYDVLFVLSAALRLAAVVVFLPFVHEPAARSTFYAIRFMGSNLYNNVHGAALGPVRMLKVVLSQRERRSRVRGENDPNAEGDVEPIPLRRAA